jgi:hypothetical protein
MEMFVVVLYLVVDIVVYVENPKEMESYVDRDGKGSIPITEEHLAQ